MTRKQISVISPCYNEAAVIKDFYVAVKSVLSALPDIEHEIILVDDGSQDGTAEILRQLAAQDPSLKAVILSRNFGHQIALTAGVDYTSGDAMIMMDSDLQHPAQLLPMLIEEWQKGCDVVSMVRVETQGAGFFKRCSSQLFYVLFNALSRTTLPMGAADFCLLSRPVYTQLKNMPERHRFLRGLICWLGFNRKLIPYTADARKAGVSKYSMTKMVRLASEAIFSFSSKPLTTAIRVGLLLTAAGFGYLLYILYGFFIKENLVPGWASLICTLLILNGFQLIFIGLIGEYVAKIFEEVKGRPIYVVKEHINTEPADRKEA
ncbi:MAG: glycosyltransferase family 2 protein [Planctomycetaceae bacterium]|nr:glycosyltransferase family 2 protein [Planctomycetaceae bacterium]